MPTYEYECLKCHHAFEEFHSMTSKKVIPCPKCQGKTKRLIGPGSGIIFKGSGFYATDYRKTKPGSPDSGSSGKKQSTDKKPG